MSELKAYRPYANRDGFYHKSEVDAVIVEKDKEIEELKDKALQYKVLDKEHCRDLNTQERFFAKQIAHHKHKRCLAMANFCFTKSLFLRYVLADRIQNGENYISANDWRINLYEKWCERLKKLAEKFKEEK